MAHDALELGRIAGLGRARVPSRSATAVRPRQNPVLWGLLGFLVGAVFWHLVGFWSFVADAVFRGPQGAIAGAAPTAAPPAIPSVAKRAPSPRPGRTVTPGVNRACSAISRDPLSDRLQQASCGAIAANFGRNPTPGRRDKLPGAALATPGP